MTPQKGNVIPEVGDTEDIIVPSRNERSDESADAEDASVAHCENE